VGTRCFEVDADLFGTQDADFEDPEENGLVADMLLRHVLWLNMKDPDYYAWVGEPRPDGQRWVVDARQGGRWATRNPNEHHWVLCKRSETDTEQSTKLYKYRI